MCSPPADNGGARAGTCFFFRVRHVGLHAVGASIIGWCPMYTYVAATSFFSMCIPPAAIISTRLSVGGGGEPGVNKAFGHVEFQQVKNARLALDMLHESEDRGRCLALRREERYDSRLSEEEPELINLVAWH